MALPNGPMEIVFSFDTTGSMYECIEEVRGRVSDMIQRLQADIPGIKIAIFAHGDYCDKGTAYVTKFIDFTDDVAKAVDFVKNAKNTWGGGDGGECYELVMHEVRTKLSWTPGSQRALVLIGDDGPHGPSFRQNKLKLDWRKEADSLASIGVRIYSVQCDDYEPADYFYAGIAQRTDGQHLRLKDFKNLFDFLMTVCYRERGDDLFHNYEKEVRSRDGKVHKDLDKLFGVLRKQSSNASMSAGSSTQVVSKSKRNTTSKGIKNTKTPATSLKQNTTTSKKQIRIKSPISKPGISRVSKRATPAKMQSTQKKQMRKTSTPASTFKRYEEKYLPKLRRENVPQSNFALRELQWSPWKIAIAPDEQKQLKITCARAGDGCGYRAEEIFKGKTQVPALYEVSVQTNHRAKRHIMYHKLSCKGFRSLNSKWENRLLGNSNITAQIDSVVKKGCCVYIRRVLLTKPKMLNEANKCLTRYDYAWNVVKSERTGHRQVTKNSIDISNEMDIS
ncbi:uncharacterized protein LOC132735233 [Ruditapes philippinarum]|uniref:uncharacterized protein LOC132735233 n=1 Tax=Ruditapes philippinarum TaxID=129788 RepID=UPI00295BC10D|nr:uncharacterized protein LOC132735233 [Ruditapes philippinarum]